MILVDSAQDSERGLQQAITFCAQLNAAGLPAVLGQELVSDGLSMPLRFESQRFLRPTHAEMIEVLIIIGGNAPDDSKLAKLRRLTLAPDAPVLLFGHYETRQAELSSIAKFSYVTAREPDCINLMDMQEVSAGKSPCPCFGVPTPLRVRPFLRGRDAVQIFAPDFGKNAAMAGVNILRSTGQITPIVLTSGKAKTQWLNQYGPGAHIYGYSEVLPHILSDMARILVLAGDVASNYRALCGLNNHVLSGSAIIDATPDGMYETQGLPVLRGPTDLSYLPAYLNEIVVPNLDGIAGETQRAADNSGLSLRQYLSRSALAPWLEPETAPKPTKSKPKIVFKPTNGVGLGHAQRCTLIAAEMKKSPKKVFAAFPSCLPMINRYGFDAVPMVSRSYLHKDITANDLVNFSRLGATLAPNDLFVFDGGYVFDSVYRTIIEKNLAAVWIRRGLWSAVQDNRVPLDREKVFEKVIVPQEAFRDLNHAYSGGAHVHAVGPIVQRIDGAKQRKKLFRDLAKQVGLKFDRLVVTMLGGGVAADLSAHAQAVCNTVETRDDTLNLIVVWPGAIVPPAFYSWTRSRVVTTHHAGVLAASADVIVSAAGYNSVHEALYNQTPAIFVPQVANYMDNQTARAETTEELGVALHVPPARPGQIDRALRRVLDGTQGDDMRAALAALDLPEPGNTAAAQIIAEMAS